MTHAQHIRNLLKVYDATRPDELEDSLASYQRYHDLIAEVASQTGTELRLAVGVFSALSPNNSYLSNLRNCRTLLSAFHAGKAVTDFRVNTYNPNKEKAWAMAGGVDPLELFKGRKTRAFYLNILDPMDPSEPVTVDGHMYWVWIGRKGAVKHRGERRGVISTPHLSQRLYDEIADGVRLVGELRGGVKGCQAQAVLWQTWRRLHNVQGAQQMQLIAPDVFAAGNHNHKHATKGCGQ